MSPVQSPFKGHDWGNLLLIYGGTKLTYCWGWTTYRHQRNKQYRVFREGVCFGLTAFQLLSIVIKIWQNYNKLNSDKMPLHELAFAESEATFETFDNNLMFF